MVPGENRIFNNDERRSSLEPLVFNEPFGEVKLYESSRIVCPKTWIVYDCRYSYHRMYYILGGDAVYSDAHKRVPLKKGYLYVFPSKTRRYQIVHDIDHPLDVLWCHFDFFPEFMNDLIEYDCSKDAFLQNALKLWMELTKLEAPGNEITTIVILILQILNRRIRLERASDGFAQIEQLIRERISEGISVESLARSMGYERSYFTRKFSSVYGVSPGKYIFYMKMFEAARLLDSDASIADVCKRLGYEDRKAFSRAFKSYYKMSPSNYKNRTDRDAI